MTTREVMEALLEGRKIIFKGSGKYELLNDEGELVNSDGVETILGDALGYELYQEPKKTIKVAPYATFYGFYKDDKEFKEENPGHWMSYKRLTDLEIEVPE